MRYQGDEITTLCFAPGLKLAGIVLRRSGCFEQRYGIHNTQY